MTEWEKAQDIVKIPLSKDKYAIIDSTDNKLISKHKWYYSHGYAVRHPKMVNGVRKGKIMMHRVINNTPISMHTDHINGDRLDNRKSNLRAVNTPQNVWNSKIERDTTTGIKNVSVSNDGYQVRVQKNGKRHFVGLFKNLDKAVHCATKFRKEYYGEYTRE